MLIALQDCFSQDMLNMFMPFRATDWRIELEGVELHRTPIENSTSKVTQRHESFALTRRVLENEKDLLFVNARYQKLDFTSRESLLDDYYDMQIGFQFRRNIENNRFYSVTANYGSSSNKPFESSDVTTFSTNFIYKFNQKWFGIINYSNNRNFLNNIPLPSFLYLHTMTRNEVLILGFPVIFWKTQTSENTSFQFSMFGPNRISMRSTYTKNPHTPFLLLEQTQENFLKHERISRDYQIFWMRRVLALGMDGMIYKGVTYETQLGHAFDQSLQESKGLRGDKLSQIKFEDDLFIKLNLRLNF